MLELTAMMALMFIHIYLVHDDVIKWKHFQRYWPFVWGIHRSPVNSPHKGQWRRALIFSLICVWINDWVNNGEAGDLRPYRAYYDVTVMWQDRFHVRHVINRNWVVYGKMLIVLSLINHALCDSWTWKMLITWPQILLTKEAWFHQLLWLLSVAKCMDV